jgi:hypothetical protein
MAKKKKEEVVEATTEEPKLDTKVDKIKVKPKMKKFVEPEDGVVKVDLNKKEVNDKQEETNLDTETKEEVVDEKPQKQDSVEKEDKPVIEEIISEKEINKEVEETAEVIEEAITDSIEKNKPLPENVDKLIKFMEETGGDLNDYVGLNKDYNELDNQDLLYEYYKQTKPHLDSEEISFLMEDQFSYNESEDSEKEIKRKKLALKEQVASAKSHLDGLKSKYYKDIKMGSKLTSEQQEAIDFFNRYKKSEQEQKQIAKKQKSTFLNKTDQVFNDEFKGFEYNVGEKKFRFNVNNANKVKDTQTDINNFVRKFLNEKNEMSDARGYHKGLFTAMNADAIANHFYEQGKTDALKDSIAKSKNVDMSPRQAYGEIQKGGLKVKALNDDGPDFKFKIKNK